MNVFRRVSLILITASLVVNGGALFARGSQEAAPEGRVTINWVNWVSVEEGTRVISDN
jgi:hypothetical protein